MRKAILYLKKSDPVMRGIIERIGPFKMQYGEPTFHSLAEAIIYQQLNGNAALTIFKRFAALAGEPLTPEGILKVTPEQMRSVGLSKQKSSYLLDMAGRAHGGTLDFSHLAEMSEDQVIEHLTQVKGVGVWTAHMFLIFSLRRPNVLPVGDLGVRMAIQRAYRKRKPPTPKQVEQIGKGWHPYCSYAAWYLWRSLEFPKEKPAPHRREKSTTEARRRGEKQKLKARAAKAS